MTSGSIPAFKRSERIAERVREMILKGCTIKTTLEHIQATFQDAPGSINTFYKYYKKDIDQARGELEEDLSDFGLKAAKALAAEGKTSLLELALKSKANWRPVDVVAISQIETEDEEEQLSAVDTLIGMIRPKPNKEND